MDGMQDNFSQAQAVFRWDDPFLLQNMLDEDETLVADTARAFADAELRPRVKDAYLNERLPPNCSGSWEKRAFWA